jgi:hypothetical protein
VQIFGGSSIVREGKGKIVERLYREVRPRSHRVEYHAWYHTVTAVRYPQRACFWPRPVFQTVRQVRSAAIPGGSEEILLDFAMRQVTSGPVGPTVRPRYARPYAR